MIRKIITIDEKKCNGCGLCVTACHEGAIQMIDGKARLVSESYCDGLGDCLPACPTDAIQIEERESAAYDEAAVKARLERNKTAPVSVQEASWNNTGTLARTIERPSYPAQLDLASLSPVAEKHSELRQWPVQIKLIPVNAPFFHNADLLIAATCSAFSYAKMHEDFIKKRIVIIGCPKLDGMDYAEKLADIFANNEIHSVTVVRMDIPCCGGLTSAVKRAFSTSGMIVPWQVVTISSDGKILEE